MTENIEPSNGQGEVVSAGEGGGGGGEGGGGGGGGEGEGDQQVALADSAGPPAAQDPAAQDGGQQQARQPTAGESFMAITKSLVIRAIIIYFITSFFRRPQQPTGPQGGTEGQLDPSGRNPALNLFKDGQIMDLYVYMAEFDDLPPFRDPKALVWCKKDLVFGDWTSGPNGDGTYTKSITFNTSSFLRNNGSIYLHVYFVMSGNSPNPADGLEGYNKKYTVYSSQRLNKYKRRRYKKTSNLITGETKLTDEEVMKADTLKEEVVSHWHPNITVNMVYDFTQWTPGAVPPPLDEYMEFTPAGDRYKPIVFMNTYWNLVKDYQPINHTSEILDLSVTFQPLSLFRWQLYAAQAMKSRYECQSVLPGCQQHGQGASDLELSQIMQLPENECPAFELYSSFRK
ncbi:Cleft lip and palate transmembrane protein 1-like 1 [Homarus americanus]|uniref:Cleft lip and palate transmembrane protein 1-like 1 n=1 Tax=Homarus americanus TaxID=6706 RepID=A0A8J5JP71_HOMAM|nr:Cleft lip and palate transmembrane protein 1-like 1 [Homarus americanus]